LNKLKQLVKRNLYLSITLEILAISLVFTGVILAIFSEDNDVDQTSIGFIYLGNSSETISRIFHGVGFELVYIGYRSNDC